MRNAAILDAEGWYMIRDMRRSGMSISAIARKTGISRNTVKKHLREYITQQIEKYDLSAI